ncbi:hypothetical protein HDU97_000648 [Phlyctochytrium planicorne]|nr:hypothetical protein HDU97_000648 [Phlyctochytrium planicorne]
MSSSISLNVGLLTGKSFSVDVRLTETVFDLKTRIEEEESIPKEAQVLIFKEKPLSNECFIGDLGVIDGSNLQLVVQMNGGPGPPVRLKNSSKKEDSVLFLLCKQDEGLYMLELHVKGGKGATPSRQLLNLADGQTLRVMSTGGKTVLMGINPALFEDENDDEENNRPGSSDSTISTSSFLTYLDSTSIEASAAPSVIPSAVPSRNTSASTSSGRQRTSCSLKKRSRSPRPATAISVMRLPNSVGQITFLKSRPATATKVGISTDRVHTKKSVPPRDSPNERAKDNPGSAKTVRFLTSSSQPSDTGQVPNFSKSEKRVKGTSVSSAKSRRGTAAISKTASQTTLMESEKVQTLVSNNERRPTPAMSVKRDDKLNAGAHGHSVPSIATRTGILAPSITERREGLHS